ncbi:hypothetical protein OKW21_005398 [Catalinimonas alkaloidigena]|uniref:hypothetical protein n=1 Tax=Catalinimonas alkaloidigena TaxID=1075417 RepID=UPI0024061FB9|nr:hypothetical protein [Catalinimonas alkaloidigena]MDF9800135.1 hypothetical protein [Catalinimonas alkaloidigena]
METQDRLDLQEEFKHCDLYLVENKPILIIKATDTYIPIEEFKQVFSKATELIREHQVRKVIFDKRRMKVFHQPSMEWYYKDWKEELLALEMKTHRKLLPDDEVFKKSVELGKLKINEKYPGLRLSEMDIRYFDDLQEAIDQ